MFMWCLLARPPRVDCRVTLGLTIQSTQVWGVNCTVDHGVGCRVECRVEHVKRGQGSGSSVGRGQGSGLGQGLEDCLHLESFALMY
jgi:hypothetical protein